MREEQPENKRTHFGVVIFTGLWCFRHSNWKDDMFIEYVCERANMTPLDGVLLVLRHGMRHS